MMKCISQLLVLAGLGLASGVGFAATGYVDAPKATIVRTGHGECLHTVRWSVENAIAECDPEIVAARDKVEVAAVEVVVRKELKPIRLEADALFGFDSAELTSAGRARLDEVVRSLPDRSVLKDKRITVVGHTDKIGPDSHNQPLSERRAQAVHDYLVSKGMPDEAIDAKGVGSSQPLVGCEGKSGAPLIDCLAPNRRTEIEFSAMEVIEVEEEVIKAK